MRGYAGLDRNLGPWVRFVTNDEIDEGLLGAFLDLRSKALVAYLDIAQPSLGTLADRLGDILALDHPPYGEHWVRFLDDLITLAHRSPGLVIIVDNAKSAFLRKDRQIFDLVESFLIQHHHWQEQNKPCHLWLQMEPCAAVREAVERTASGL